MCLSGTYDIAFDQHLISFDEDYRMIVCSEIRDHFTTAITRYKIRSITTQFHG